LTKTKPENLEANFSDSTKPTRNFADERKLFERKNKNLKNATAKKMNLNFRANHKNETCESKTVLHLLFGAASQRLALAARADLVEKPNGRTRFWR